jgi:CHAT domain-containing protein
MITKLNIILILSLLGVNAFASASVEMGDSKETLRQKGDISFQNGAFPAALEAWGLAAEGYRSAGDVRNYIALSVNRAEVLGQSGRVNESLPLLLHALGVAEKSNDTELQALVRFGLAQSYFLMGEVERSTDLLIEALELLDNNNNDKLTALILNGLGNATSAQGEQPEAIEYFEEAGVSATDSGNPLIAAKAYINAARTAIYIDQPERSENYVDEAVELLDRLPTSYQKGFSMLSLGKVLASNGSDNARLKAFNLYTKTAGIAGQLNNPTLMSYASGYKGALYEREGRAQEALGYTEKALFKALESDDIEARYLWQWQMARLLKKLNRHDEAINYYRQAVSTLVALRKDILATPIRRHLSFRSSVGKVYYELADLLLKRVADSGTAGLEKNMPPDLLEARDTIEQLKAAELEDYFNDECVTALENKKVTLDKEVDGRTLVIYPIILPDRLELLVSSPEKMRRFSVPVDDITLVKEIRGFREALENYRGDNYRPHARQLYRWLIEPIEINFGIDNVDTLVFVPDGALRTVPMAPLYDGKRFLIERFAVVSTPGLILTDPRPMELASPKILLNGLSESVQGYDALPAVEQELKAIHELYGGRVLKNEGFISTAVKNELEETPYTLVHIATHGKIEADVRDSYLLTYDGKLTIDDLEAYIGYSRFRVKGVELLTLSACETAVGDDRAALGLAGIALKAGARSALATLWSISDEATSKLIPIFYNNLKNSPNKAKALQQAQLGLLNQQGFNHPGFWAPFMLIGNWL